ncbi:hypothetical protein [Endozoicomonas numazuensis]|uniref:hypothetical protein n=1 Tax=Endozoicomonas numazuensis TaxID=1137799 RepID=UPI000AC56F82|nr:hypothetical protein [Endozoicomonas numazuensis]
MMLLSFTSLLQAEITLIPEKKTPLPLVSATELDPLTTSDIHKRYPKGFRIFTNNITPLLRKKLNRLTTTDYQVQYVQPDGNELRKITLSVVQNDGFSHFLVKVLGEKPGCSPFLSQEMTEYGTRKHGRPLIKKISKLPSLTTKDLLSLIQDHHWWINVGYENYQNTPEVVTSWLHQAGYDNAKLINAGLKDCSVTLSKAQLDEFSQLTALSYLNNAVRGLFYSKQGSSITHYRTVAVESLNKSNSKNQ